MFKFFYFNYNMLLHKINNQIILIKYLETVQEMKAHIIYKLNCFNFHNWNKISSIRLNTTIESLD